MSALNYSLVADLCHSKLGIRDVACPLCGPERRSPENRKRRVLRIWHQESGFATYCCQRCGAKGYARTNSGGGDHPRVRPQADKQSGFDHATRQLERGRREPIEGSPAEIYLSDARGDDAKRTEAGLAIWNASTSADGSLVETYLATRGLHLSLPPTLRFHAGLKHPSGGIWPAMVALVIRGVDDAPLAIHRTFLAREGSGKAPVDLQKMMLGPLPRRRCASCSCWRCLDDW
jgi:hypothetical protein